MQRGASQRSSEDPTVRQRGTVSNQGGRGNPSSETDHRNAPSLPRGSLQRMEADEGFAVPQIPAAPVPGLRKRVRGPEEQEGGGPSPPFPTVAAHRLLLSCSFHLSTDWKPTRLL